LARPKEGAKYVTERRGGGDEVAVFFIYKMICGNIKTHKDLKVYQLSFEAVMACV
jgi:hypothetical protein